MVTNLKMRMNVKSLKIVILSSLLFLCSCAKTIEVETVCQDKLPLGLEAPESVDMSEVEFIIINEDNSEAVFKQLRELGIDPVLFGLTGTDYKALAVNIQEIIKHILIQRKIIEEYKEYYESEEETD